MKRGILPSLHRNGYMHGARTIRKFLQFTASQLHHYAQALGRILSLLLKYHVHNVL